MATKKTLPKITAATIKDLLSVRHSKDVFVRECKNGPTWNASALGILDAWAMKRSWANPCMWGYEIKVARSDFLRDDKWQGYLPYCNQFYFVTTPGLIALNEVPSDAGLICCSRTGTRLYTKKKAPFRDIQPPADLLTYVLFSRASIDVDQHRGPRVDNETYFREWLEKKEITRELGMRVRGALATTIRDRILSIDLVQSQLEKRTARLEGLAAVMEELGLYPSYATEHDVRRKAAQLAEIIPPDFRAAVIAMLRTARECQEAIDKHLAPEAAQEGGSAG